MIKEGKCVEYFFDSKQYNKLQVLENMKREQLEFEKKKAEINITLNEHGIYIAKLKFFKNELSVMNNKIIKMIVAKRKIKNASKLKKTYKGYETYSGKNAIYGQYKATKTYQPYKNN